MNPSNPSPPAPEPSPRPKIRIRTGGGYLTDTSPAGPAAPATPSTPATPVPPAPASPARSAAVAVPAAAAEPATGPTGAATPATPASAPVVAGCVLPVRWEALALPGLAMAPGVSLGICVLLLVLVAAGGWSTAPVGLWLGLMLGATAWRLASLALGWNVPVAVAHVVGAGLVTVALGVAMGVVLPAWEREAARFEGTVVSVSRRLLPAQSQADWAQAEAAHERFVTRVSASRQRLWVQSLLMLWVVAAWPALSRFVAPSPERPGTFWTAVLARLQRGGGRLALACTGRLAQAVVLTGLAVSGAVVGGLPAAWYVGGWVMVLTWVWPPAGWWPCLVAGVLVAGAVEVVRAGVALLVATAAMVVVGRWLQRQLVFRPGVMAGWAEPQIVTGPQHGVLWWTVRGIRIAIGFALVATLVWLGVEVVPEVRRDQARRDAIAAAESGQAWEPWQELLREYPNDPAVWLGVVTAHCRRGEYGAALPYAAQYAAWQPPPVGSAGGTLKARVLAWLQVAPTIRNRAEGYEIILDSIRSVESHPAVVSAAVARVFEINPDSVSALLAAGNLAVAQTQPDRALEIADRGLRLAPDTRGWHAIRAGAFLQKQDWPSLIAAADAELALDPANHHVATMRETARRQLQRSKR